MTHTPAPPAPLALSARTSVSARASVRVGASVSNPKPIIRRARRLIIDALLITFAFALTCGVIAWRLDQAPDVLTDEILYTRAGTRVAVEGALIWDSGEPLFVHPPLYFLIEGAYLWLTADPPSVAQAPGDIFVWVYHARYLNAVFAGLTAAILYLVGRRLRGVWLGVLLVALFVLDPFGVRINRRAMLETLAALLTLAGMTILLNREKHLNPARAVVAGLLLGAGLLTKELTFTAPLAVLLLGLWELWQSRFLASLRAFLTTAVAVLTYGIFPLWALTTGRWDRFTHVKWLSLRRLLGLTQLSGWNRPDVSLWDFLLRRLTDYGSSYLLLGLGGIAVLFLLPTQRHRPAGRLLAAWGLVLYPFYAFVALAGAGNDQFFYFLLVPAILLIGYAIAIFPESISHALARRTVTRQWFTPEAGRWLHWCSTIIAIELLVVILSFNAVRWWFTFGAGLDNAYRQLVTYAEEHLPVGEPINASGDAIKFEYFFPDRPIAEAATPEEAQTEGIHYFALAPKDVWAGYGRTTPDLATWITGRGEQLFAVNGDSYGEISLYYVDYPDGARTVSSGRRPYARSFPVAQTGFVGSFLLVLGLWGLSCSIVGGLTTWIEWRRAAQPAPLSARHNANTPQRLETKT